MAQQFTENNETWKGIGGYFGECGENTPREFLLDILPHMRRDIYAGLVIVRWVNNQPVVRDTYRNLGVLQDWACDMYGYGFELLWNGK